MLCYAMLCYGVNVFIYFIFIRKVKQGNKAIVRFSKGEETVMINRSDEYYTR